jgi:serine protease Do
MNNEFNNNENINYNPNSDPNNNSYINPNNYPYESNEPKTNGNETYNSQTTYSYVSSNIIQDFSTDNINREGYRSDMGYSSVVTEEVRPKKKRRFLGALKITAAAIAFGIIAGAAFQGYYMLAWSEDSKTSLSSDESSNIQIKEVNQESTSKDIINPIGNESDTVVTDVSGVVEKVMPSIVAINSKATVTRQDFFGREFSQESEGSGSGIIIAQNKAELLIVTNNHVVQGATAIEIVFSDDTKASATIKGSEANADLAVLTVDINSLSKETASAIKVATLGNSDEMAPGEMVIAIGNALGYGQSVTVGYVSAVNREVTIENQTMTLLQTDAAINPGNSGGALINTSGQVIGINSVKFASAQVEGMGYAIPISDAVPMINELMNREIVAAEEQGFLGIDSSTAQEVNEIYAERFNMPIGVYVNDVVAGSPAEKAGLMQGDIITGLDGSKIETIADLKNALSYKKAGQTVKLIIQVLDGGAYTEKVLEVTLGTK